MKQVMVVLFLLMASFSDLYAQRSGDLPKPEKLDEPDLHQPRDLSPWAGIRPGLKTSFVSTNLHYDKFIRPQVNQQTYIQQGWRNEQVNCEILVWSKSDESTIRLSCSPFVPSRPGVALALEPVISLLKNVIGEESAGKCGFAPNKLYKPGLYQDLLEDASSFKLTGSNVRAVWLSVKIPLDLAPGTYKSIIFFKTQENIELKRMNWILTVSARKIPDLQNTEFYLNIWQNPYFVASYNHVQPWSSSHFNLLRPVMSLLARAGQKCITASFFWNSFNAQSQDLTTAMIIPTKLQNGTWLYDYTHFDQWVSFMIRLGIKKEIAVFGLDPWYPNIYYFNDITKKEVNEKAVPGTAEYQQFWTPLLKDFRDHLVKKGWLSLVSIGIDERAATQIRADIDFVHSIDKRYRFQVSGEYRPELEPEIYDYALNSNQVMPDSVLIRRKTENKISSYYTACWEIRPNSFICNEPGDSWFLPVHSFALQLNGFSRYAFNIWSTDNLTDSRNRDVPPGDAYFVYPGARSSLRFEKLKEGIMFAEKLHVLKNESRRKTNSIFTKRLIELLDSLKKFDSPSDSIIRRQVALVNAF